MTCDSATAVQKGFARGMHSIQTLSEVIAFLCICRHNTMAAGMLLGGVACIGCAVTPGGAGQAVLAAVGKFGIAGSFAIASIYTR